MADIPGYDVQDAVPWNPESGKNLSPGREAVPLAWGTDILADPADNDNVHDPATGWGKGAGVRSS